MSDYITANNVPWKAMYEHDVFCMIEFCSIIGTNHFSIPILVPICSDNRRSTVILKRTFKSSFHSCPKCWKRPKIHFPEIWTTSICRFQDITYISGFLLHFPNNAAAKRFFATVGDMQQLFAVLFLIYKFGNIKNEKTFQEKSRS